MTERLAGSGQWVTGHPDDLLASYALDVLDPDEATAVAAHIADCVRCTVEVEHLRTAADAMAFAVVPVPPPPESRDALLRRIRDERPAAPRPPRRARPLVVAPAVGWLAAAACLVLALVSGLQLRASQQHVAEVQQENEALTRADREESLVLASFDPASTRLVALSGTGATPNAGGRIMYDARARRAVVVLERLPPLEPGKTYQLWLLQGGAAPLSAGTWDADDGLLGSLIIQAPAELPNFAGLGVTLEPVPGSAAPTGPLVLAGTF